MQLHSAGVSLFLLSDSPFPFQLYPGKSAPFLVALLEPWIVTISAEATNELVRHKKYALHSSWCATKSILNAAAAVIWDLSVPEQTGFTSRWTPRGGKQGTTKARFTASIA